MFVPLLILVLAMCGLALDAGAMYNRKVELSGLARAAALAAAQELNGTSAGIAAAQLKAKETAENFTYQYGLSVTWKDAALSLGTTPARSGAWVPAAEVTDASKYYFVKVDTSALDIGTVSTTIMQLISSTLTTVTLSETAVAGRAGINALPIAVCAMSETPAAARTNTGLADTELVEYGFRRGVNYDLMQLNPKATTPARFLINPVAAPGMSSSAFDTSIMGPFMCVGAMWIPQLKGGTIHVSELPSTSPLDGLFTQLNSRLDDYSGSLCSPSSAPPDNNVKPYPYDKPSGAPWMVPATGLAAAHTTTERGFLETVADIPPPGSTLPGLVPGWYGPLWSYAKAVKYSSYAALGVPEPGAGYSTFSTTDWGNLYKTGLSSTGYPTAPQSTPYNPIGVISPTTLAAPATSRKDFITPLRRVLNVPLLSCTAVPSGSNGEATVTAIAKFFMTVPATADSLIAEFAGTTPDQLLTGPVMLYP
jgi:Flp pilus assembly protein TadG